MHNRLADNQLRYVLAEKFSDNSFPIPVSYRFAGQMDPRRLEDAINHVIGKHRILRSRIALADDEYRAEYLDGPFHHRCDTQSLPAYDEDAARRHMIRHFYAGIDKFDPDTLIKSQIITCGDGEVVVTLSLHHMISDGVSTAIFIDDVFRAYNGDTVPEGADYAALAATLKPDLPADQRFWADYLADMAPTALAHDLRASVPLEDRKPCRIELPLATLQQLADSLGARPFHVAAALEALLMQWTTGDPDACFTYQSAGRHLLPRDARVIGPFSNTLVMRLDCRDHADFPALVRGAATALHQTRAHEFYPRRQILSEFNAQTAFGINFYPPAELPVVDGLRCLDQLFLYTQTEFGIDFRFELRQSDIRLYLFYDPEQISARLIGSVADKFRWLLEAAAANPQAPLDALLPPRPAIAAAAAQGIAPARLFDEFLAVAQRMPGRLALADKAEQLTYGEVERDSAAIAAQLVAAGLGPGARVAIHAERTVRHVCNLLGVFRAGAIAIPLDSDYPGSRLATLIDVARPDALLSARDLHRPDWAAAIDRHLVADPDHPRGNLPEPDPEAPAYILFTSGSTGRPKGVATPHLPIVHFLRWQRQAFDITAEDRFSNLNGLAHDMILRDIFAPLSVGASLHIPEQEQIFIPGGLARWCALSRPTFVHLTPAMAQMVLAGMAPGSLKSVRIMIFGGDRLQPELTEQIYAAIPGVEIINFYGATETPQAATCYACVPGVPFRTQPIGRGIPDFTAQIVDAERQPVHDGVVGEIAITSPYLSLGYVADGEITPHATPETYYTGDQGFVLPDGNIIFVGRQDDQVSIRGARVELGEITATLKREAGVRDALVLMEHPDNPRLVAFVAGDGLEAHKLRAELASRLPRYMVPADFVLLEALPLLPNGKPDRQKMLALPRRDQSRAVEIFDEISAEEQELIDAWARLLGHNDVAPGHSFADLGGDSLNYVQAYLVAERILGDVPDGWDTLTIRELVALGKPAPAGVFGRLLTTIESTMLTRAIAIVLIVGLHLHVFAYGGGGTTALMLVSGVLMARTTVGQTFLKDSAKPMLDLFLRVLIPCLLYAWAYTGAKLLLGRPVYWQVPTLTVNFVDFRAARAAGMAGWPVYLWYVGALLQIFLFFYIFARINLKLRLLKTPEAFAGFLLAFGCFGRFVLPGLVNSAFWTDGFAALPIMARMPTTHLGTIALGMLIGLHRQQLPGRLWMALVVVGYAGLTSHFSSTNEHVMLLGFGMLMLFVHRLPTIRGFSVVVLGISGASLFIYLTQMQFAQLWALVGVPKESWMLWGLTVISGMLCWVGWQYVKPASRAVWEKGWRSLPGRRTLSSQQETL